MLFFYRVPDFSTGGLNINIFLANFFFIKFFITLLIYALFSLALENVSHIPIGYLDVSITEDERNPFVKVIFDFTAHIKTLMPGEKTILEGFMIAQIDYEKKEEKINQFLEIKYKGKMR